MHLYVVGLLHYTSSFSWKMHPDYLPVPMPTVLAPFIPNNHLRNLTYMNFPSLKNGISWNVMPCFYLPATGNQPSHQGCQVAWLGFRVRIGPCKTQVTAGLGTGQAKEQVLTSQVSRTFHPA